MTLFIWPLFFFFFYFWGGGGVLLVFVRNKGAKDSDD